MNKNLLRIGIVAIAFAVVPLLASAQTLASSSVSGSAAGNGTVMWGPGPACPPIIRPLSVGSTGSDVISLQTFLVAHSYLKVSPTGYFGPLTQSAVAHWQADGGVAVQGSTGSGFFGPLSRAFFMRSCGTGGTGGTGGTTPPATTTFTANPQSGPAPLTVQFTSSAQLGSTNVGGMVNFGDGTSAQMIKGSCIGITAVVGGQGGILCSYSASHTYSSTGTYTAMLTSSNCVCPLGGTCNCPMTMTQVLATTTVTVGPASGGTTTSIQDINAPSSVTLSAGGIAEVRNRSYYFTLQNVNSSSATIQPTPVGCWNSFPSDTTPVMHCMIATVLIPPQTLSVGQSYQSGNFNITLTAISYGQATFSLN